MMVRPIKFILLFAAVAMFSLIGCATNPQPAAITTAKPAVALANRPMLAHYLPQLAKGHHDKVQLAFLSKFKGLTAPVAQFNSNMATQQKQLLKELKAWAKRHHLSLKYHYPKNIRGTALRELTDEDGHLLLFAGSAEFQRIYLVLMYSDFDWQAGLDKALIAQPVGPGLKQYLTAALKTNEASRKQILKFLQMYHWKTK